MDKSTRINMQIRGHIQRRLRETQFGPLEKELEHEEPSIALNAYYTLYTEEQRQIMLNLPKGFLKECTCIDVRVEGEYHRLRFAVGEGEDRKSMRFTYDNSTLYTKANSAVGKVITNWERRKEAFKEKRNEALRQAGAFIGSYRTVGALVKAWPEVVDFLPPNVETATTALALPVKQLNKMLGLP